MAFWNPLRTNIFCAFQLPCHFDVECHIRPRQSMQPTEMLLGQAFSFHDDFWK